MIENSCHNYCTYYIMQGYSPKRVTAGVAVGKGTITNKIDSLINATILTNYVERQNIVINNAWTQPECN